MIQLGQLVKFEHFLGEQFDIAILNTLDDTLSKPTCECHTPIRLMMIDPYLQELVFTRILECHVHVAILVKSLSSTHKVLFSGVMMLLHGEIA